MTPPAIAPPLAPAAGAGCEGPAVVAGAADSGAAAERLEMPAACSSAAVICSTTLASSVAFAVVKERRNCVMVLLPSTPTMVYADG